MGDWINSDTKEKIFIINSDGSIIVNGENINDTKCCKIKIDYYGVPTSISQLAGISVPEARLIVIQPWDLSVLKEIEKENKKIGYEKL